MFKNDKFSDTNIIAQNTSRTKPCPLGGTDGNKNRLSIIAKYADSGKTIKLTASATICKKGIYIFLKQ